MEYRIVDDLAALPISDRELERIEDMPYQFGYAQVFKTYAAIKADSGYCYEIVHFDCEVAFND